jgi:hypothetical protein
VRRVNYGHVSVVGCLLEGGEFLDDVVLLQVSPTVLLHHAVRFESVYLRISEQQCSVFRVNVCHTTWLGSGRG